MWHTTLTIVYIHTKSVYLLLFARIFRYGGDRRTSARPLFIRGFSTVSQRGVIDSTAEFEIINTHRGSSSSSYPGDQHSQKDGARGSSVTSASGKPPKKPGRKKTRTSSAAVRYENVNIAPRGGVSVGHSDMDIPYMDRTLESRISLDDDVFE